MMKDTKMKNSAVLSVLILGLAAALTAVPAFAVSITVAPPLYNNTTPYSYTTGSYQVSDDGYAVTDSFTLKQAATVNGATFVLWVPDGDWSDDAPSSVDWEITSGMFSGTMALGKAVSLPNTSCGTSSGGDSVICDESISIPSLPLAAGTYYFQLSNAVTGDGDPVGWDESDGLSLAYQNIPLAVDPPIPSETFHILGDTGPVVPEPSSFLLLGSGLAGLAGLLKRKLKA
jgi:hypothetical protein